MRSRYLVVTALVCTQGFFASAAPITVNRAMVFQTLEGFGAQGAAKAWTDDGPYYDSVFVHRVLMELGLNIIRDDIRGRLLRTAREYTGSAGVIIGTGGVAGTGRKAVVVGK